MAERTANFNRYFRALTPAPFLPTISARQTETPDSMTFCDLTLPTPAENLACDEALLDACESAEADEALRVWESDVPFVVVGYANKLGTEVNRAACEARGIPILRRCSGGGTVVQGPGCLNYALILRIENAGPLAGIHSANCHIMKRNQAALQSALSGSRVAPSVVEVRGHTDLAIGDVKFSGNAQRRRKRSLLFHGSLLLDFDLPLLETLLPLPSQKPEYRRNRSHAEFLANLSIPAARVKHALRQEWKALETLTRVPLERIQALVREKYSQPGWNEKF
jgi:lipoate---protein ligase